MKTLLAIVLVGAAATACADPVAPFSWMQGCWRATDNAEAGTVIGMSRTVRKGKTVAWEFLQIREVEPGKLAYIAMSSGRAPTTFALLRQDGKEFVFENLAHDFPQRIIYRRDGEQKLFARIEGSVQGKAKGIDFPMTRIPCEAP